MYARFEPSMASDGPVKLYSILHLRAVIMLNQVPFAPGRHRQGLSTMTLTELRYLVALAETGHFRKAAEQCNVSQPR